LTGDRYVTLFGDHLQPFMDFMYPHNDGTFQQDNAPCHWARVVQYWFEEHSEMVWLPRSPDMNPIKHLWDVVERSIRTQNLAPTNTREL
jgi:transposase